jgi:NADH:ubiquinone oxidoreductase subunit
MDIWSRLWTLFNGTQVGSDAAGNRYFLERRSRAPRGPLRRWVIPARRGPAASVPAAWRAWLESTSDAAPGVVAAGAPDSAADTGSRDVPARPPMPAQRTAPTAGGQHPPSAKFTLVRHSAYTVGGNSDFEGAVEVCELAIYQDYQVRAAGGLVLATREAAEAAATASNYPGGDTRSAPSAPGYFSSLRIAGAEIYVPGATAHGVMPKPAPAPTRKT